MHGPPAVTWEVRPSRWQAWMLVGLALCAMLLIIGFVALQGWDVPALVLLGTLASATTLAVLELRGAPTGHLNWDGERWHWSGWGDGHSVTGVECVLDLQALVLLQLRCSNGASQWLWLEWRPPGQHWAALRRALVADRAAAQAGPNAGGSGNRAERSL